MTMPAIYLWAFPPIALTSFAATNTLFGNANNTGMANWPAEQWLVLLGGIGGLYTLIYNTGMTKKGNDQNEKIAADLKETNAAVMQLKQIVERMQQTGDEREQSEQLKSSGPGGSVRT